MNNTVSMKDRTELFPLQPSHKPHSVTRDVTSRHIFREGQPSMAKARSGLKHRTTALLGPKYIDPSQRYAGLIKRSLKLIQ